MEEMNKENTINTETTENTAPNNATLTKQEELEIARMSGTVMYNVLHGLATVVKCAGKTVEGATKITAGALRTTANVIETAGTVGSGFCYAGAEGLQNRANSYRVETKEEKAKQQAALEDIISRLKANGIELGIATA